MRVGQKVRSFIDKTKKFTDKTKKVVKKALPYVGGALAAGTLATSMKLAYGDPDVQRFIYGHL